MKLFVGLAALVAAASVAGASSAATVYFENFEGYDLSGLVNGAHGAGPSSSGHSFTTEYDFRTGTSNASGNPNSMYDEGTWTIADNPFEVHNLWVDLGSSATNKMLILNGDTSASTADPARTWISDSFAVNAGAYSYSFDLMNVCCNPQGPVTTTSTLFFRYTTNNGMTFDLASGPVTSLVTPGVFYTQNGGFVLPSAGTLRVALFDTTGAASGNDFAVDNVRLSTAAIPEPTTWALMILGFGGVGSLLRRRRSTGLATA